MFILSGQIASVDYVLVVIFNFTLLANEKQ